MLVPSDRRRWIEAGSVDHEIDHFLTDAGILKIDDLSRGEAVNNVGVTNLTNNDVVTHAGLGESFDIGKSQGVHLVNGLNDLRAWLLWSFFLGLIEAYGYGWYLALVWVPLYNVFASRTARRAGRTSA